MKKIKIKLIIDLIISIFLAILPWICYWLLFPLTQGLKTCCWDRECTMPMINPITLLIICGGISLVFIIIAIKTIKKLKNK